VELLPPAPAALVELGRAFATLSFWSAAARRLIAVLGPPGGVGEEGRPLLEPIAAPGELTGEEGRGEDCVQRELAIPLSDKHVLGCWSELGTDCRRANRVQACMKCAVKRDAGHTILAKKK
jgi:hypothetical protein